MVLIKYFITNVYRCLWTYDNFHLQWFSDNFLTSDFNNWTGFTSHLHYRWLKYIPKHTQTSSQIRSNMKHHIFTLLFFPTSFCWLQLNFLLMDSLSFVTYLYLVTVLHIHTVLSSTVSFFCHPSICHTVFHHQPIVQTHQWQTARNAKVFHFVISGTKKMIL